MKKGIKVLIVVLFVGLVAVLFAAVYMDVQERRRCDEYQRSIMSLNDSISTLRKDLSLYKEEIERLDAERDSIHKEIKIIFKDNEKIDAILANGDWDYNLRFLTDFLSSEDSVQERHRSSTDEATAH